MTPQCRRCRFDLLGEADPCPRCATELAEWLHDYARRLNQRLSAWLGTGATADELIAHLRAARELADDIDRYARTALRASEQGRPA